MHNTIKLLLLAATAMPAVALNGAWDVKYTFDSEADIADIDEIVNIPDSGAGASVENGKLKVEFGQLFEDTSNLYVLLPLGVDLRSATGKVTAYVEVTQPTVNGTKAIVDTVWGLSNIDADQVLDTRFDSFNVMQRIVVTTDLFESRNGGAYVSHEQLQADTTYSMWWVIDFDLNVWDGYVQGGQWTEPTLLGDGFYGFRADPAEGQTVDHFMIALSAGNIDEPKGRDYTYFDNIAVDLSGENLTKPGGELAETWADWGDNEVDNWVNTPGFLGWIYIGADGWIAPENFGWIYMPEGHVGAQGGWGFVPR